MKKIQIIPGFWVYTKKPLETRQELVAFIESRKTKYNLHDTPIKKNVQEEA